MRRFIPLIAVLFFSAASALDPAETIFVHEIVVMNSEIMIVMTDFHDSSQECEADVKKGPLAGETVGYHPEHGQSMVTDNNCYKFITRELFAEAKEFYRGSAVIDMPHGRGFIAYKSPNQAFNLAWCLNSIKGLQAQYQSQWGRSAKFECRLSK